MTENRNGNRKPKVSNTRVVKKTIRVRVAYSSITRNSNRHTLSRQNILIISAEMPSS